MIPRYALPAPLELAPALLAHLAFVAERSPALDPWPRECEKLTGYTRNELYACCKAVSFHLNAAPDSKRRLVACRSLKPIIETLLLHIGGQIGDKLRERAIDSVKLIRDQLGSVTDQSAEEPGEAGRSGDVC